MADLAGPGDANGVQTNGDASTQGESSTGASDSVSAEFEKTYKELIN